jgi:hypothetical protein
MKKRLEQLFLVQRGHVTSEALIHALIVFSFIIIQILGAYLLRHMPLDW